MSIDLTNSYTTLVVADAYIETKLERTDWEAASNDDKSRALLESTRALDGLNFKGARTSENQNLQFPRDDDIVIPEIVQNACIENANALLEGMNIEHERNIARMNKQFQETIKIEYDSKIPAEHIIAGIVSSVAFDMIRPYLRPITEIKIYRS